jgi:hypothetical protein
LLGVVGGCDRDPMIGVAWWLAAAIATSIAAGRDPVAITGGTPVEGCAWASAVWTDGCSGTLVDPEIVVLAAHCAPPSRVTFGPDALAADAPAIETVHCERHPEAGAAGSGHDIQWCRLATPQVRVPIVPPLSGCETDVLAPGQAVALVGYGLTPDGELGRKHEVTTEILALVGDEVQAGGMGRDTCSGDSGGPAFVQLPDGGWRVFGITSFGSADCRSGGFYTQLSHNMAWLETRTGLDLTPCTDADGTWAPDARCTRAPAEPGADHGGETGAWDEGCGDVPIADSIATCGAAWTVPPGAMPPQVTIDAPADDLVRMVDAGSHLAIVEVVGTALAPDVGLGHVQLVVDGEPVADAVARTEAFAFEIDLTPGTHELVAVAVDLAGQSGASDPVRRVTVVDDEDGDGCGCRPRPRDGGAGGLGVFAGMLALGWLGRNAVAGARPR